MQLLYLEIFGLIDSDEHQTQDLRDTNALPRVLTFAG